MKKAIALIGIIPSLLFLFSTTNATVWYVHPDSTLNSIQAGLDSCSTDDTVLVAAGTYCEELAWPSTQGIDLISESGPDTTVVERYGNGKLALIYGSVISIGTGVDSTTVINGFTIRNGSSYDAGGGISCYHCSPTITGNIITGNEACISGGGIHCECSSPTITGNTITGNRADGYGGGICCAINSSATITGNVIANNAAHYYGGGIDCRVGSSPTITGNNITSNTAKYGSGIVCGGHSTPTITGNNITDNTADSLGGGIALINASPDIDNCTISSNNGGGVYCKDGSNPEIHYSNITNNIGYGVQNVDSNVIVNAKDNWWGDPNGPGGVGPGNGDEVSEWVDYDPWLTEPYGITEAVSQVSPVQFILSQNYPNPFNPITEIEYALPKDCHVRLEVYNILGRRVVTLVDVQQKAGYKRVRWDAGLFASGIYFYKLQDRDFVETKRMILLK